MLTRYLSRFIGLPALLVLAGTVHAAKVDLNNPTGSTGVLMIDKLGHHIRFFDPVTLKETANFEVAINPHDFAISPDHKTAYVPIYGDGVYGRNPNPGHTISIIDLAAHKEIGTIDVSPYQAPHGIQIDSNGIIYVTCDLSRKLLVIDPKSRSIKAAIDTEGTGHWVAVLPDASKAYIANKNDKTYVTVIDLKTRKVVNRIEVGKGTQGIVASPDGKHVLAVDYSDPVLYVIETASDTVVDKVTLEGNPRGWFKPRYTPDGAKILVCDSAAGMTILDAADLHGKQHFLTVGRNPMGFAISADGNTALVANHGDGTVSVVDLKEPRVVKTFTAGTGIETLAYY